MQANGKEKQSKVRKDNLAHGKKPQVETTLTNEY